jgi:hypothetical protein
MHYVINTFESSLSLFYDRRTVLPKVIRISFLYLVGALGKMEGSVASIVAPENIVR